MTTVRDRDRSTPARCHTQDGTRRQTSGAAAPAARAGSCAGPGAGSPYVRISVRQARQASRPVTFCSSTAGTSDSRTRPVRGTRQPGCRRHSSRTTGWRGRKPLGSSSAPSIAGSSSSTRPAPGPQAVAATSYPELVTTSRTVAGPSTVRVAHQTPARPTWIVGSPDPRDSGPSVVTRSTGRPACQVRDSAGPGGRSVVRHGHRRQSLVDSEQGRDEPLRRGGSAAVSDVERERSVANKAKSSKVAEKDRRAKVEAMRREQLARERRKSGILVVVAVIIGAG